jgi:hypothetical protein
MTPSFWYLQQHDPQNNLESTFSVSLVAGELISLFLETLQVFVDNFAAQIPLPLCFRRINNPDPNCLSQTFEREKESNKKENTAKF